MERSLEGLLVRCRDGDRQAFAVLVGLFQRKVYYTILKVVRDRHLADDLTQEVFLCMFDKLAHLKDLSSFSSWLLRMAFNRAVDDVRKRKRERERVFLVDDFRTIACSSSGEGCEHVDREEAAARKERLERRLEEAIEALPRRQRDVLLLAMGGRSSHEEIAEILGIPRGTVKSRLFHARRFIAAKMRDLLEGE